MCIQVLLSHSLQVLTKKKKKKRKKPTSSFEQGDFCEEDRGKQGEIEFFLEFPWEKVGTIFQNKLEFLQL